MVGSLENASSQAKNYLTKLQNGTFKKDHLPNHGENFTGDLENLAKQAFEKYEGSCGRMLMRIRLDKKGCRYIG